MTLKGAIILTIVISVLVSFVVYMLSFAFEDEDVIFKFNHMYVIITKEELE